MQSPIQRTASMGAAVTFEQLTVTSASAVGLTAPANAKSCFVTCSDNHVRYRTDGGAPTSSVGHLLQVGDSIEFYGDDVSRAMFIAVTSDGAVAVTYFN